MKKFLSILLALTLLCSIGIMAIADTGGYQTVSAVVPTLEPIHTATLSIRKPVNRLVPASSIEDFTIETDAHYSIDSVRINDGLPQYIGGEDASWDISLDPDLGYCFLEGSRLFLTDLDGNALGWASPTSIQNGIAYFTVTVHVPEPSWTLNVPADVTIEYGTETTNIPAASFSDLEDAGLGVIYCHVWHTGELTSGGGSIPFTFYRSDPEASIAADTPTVVGVVEIDSQSITPTISGTKMVITEAAWEAAVPGTYSTLVTYSSRLDA